MDVKIVRYLVIHKSDLLNFKTSYENLRIERICSFMFGRGDILYSRENKIASVMEIEISTPLMLLRQNQSLCFLNYSRRITTEIFKAYISPL